VDERPLVNRLRHVDEGVMDDSIPVGSRTDLPLLGLVNEEAAVNDTPDTTPLCPLRVSSSGPLAVSQTRTVWSELAEASRRPSGLNDTPWTGPVCPLRASSSFPVAAPQTHTVRSPPAEASRRPSGLIHWERGKSGRECSQHAG
jgi:hypothetical protein